MTRDTRSAKIMAMFALGLFMVVDRAASAGPISSFNVQAGGQNLGVVSFDVYQDLPSEALISVLIQGGFNLDSSYTLASGYEYRWLQTVSTTDPIYDWQSSGQTYMDRTRVEPPLGSTDPLATVPVADGSPFYNFYRGPDPNSPPNYALGFTDNPAREPSFINGSGTWSLTLVAAQTPPDESDPSHIRNIFALSTFVWGFSTDGAGAVTLKNIVQVAPETTDLFSAFASDPDHRTFSDSWKLASGLPEVVVPVVPEPSSLIMSLAATAFVGGYGAYRFRRNRAA